jgi:hypothetical protein
MTYWTHVDNGYHLNGGRNVCNRSSSKTFCLMGSGTLQLEKESRHSVDNEQLCSTLKNMTIKQHPVELEDQ